jgi:outer membrane biosynthesis protein TonB
MRPASPAECQAEWSASIHPLLHRRHRHRPSADSRRGNISPPKKIKDVSPVYPPLAQSARVQGIVIIEATIGPQGTVTDARVLRSISLLEFRRHSTPYASGSFTPTLINGVPVAHHHVA